MIEINKMVEQEQKAIDCRDKIQNEKDITLVRLLVELSKFIVNFEKEALPKNPLLLIIGLLLT